MGHFDFNVKPKYIPAARVVVVLLLVTGFLSVLATIDPARQLFALVMALVGLPIVAGLIWATVLWRRRRDWKRQPLRPRAIIKCRHCQYEITDLDAVPVKIDGLNVHRVVCPECGKPQD